MSKSSIKRLPTGQFVKCFTDSDGNPKMVPLSEKEQIRLTKERDGKTQSPTMKNFKRGVVVGTGIGVAELATGTLAATEIAVVAPTVLTIAAIGGAIWGGVALVRHLSK